MKKSLKIVCIILGALVTVVCWVVLARAVFLKSFDVAKGLMKSFYNPYIWEYDDGTWVCEELNLEFTIITYTSEEEAKDQVGTIVKDGETIEIVYASSFSRQIHIYDKKEHDESIAETGGVACEPILIISYKFEDKNPIAKGTVTKDILFDVEWLDKEVTVKKVE